MSDISTQCSAWSPTWEYLRDYARPIVPDDVDQLALVRQYGPPAGKKRVLEIARKVRLDGVSKAAPVVEPAHAERRAFSSAHSHGMALRRRLHPGRFYTARPLEAEAVPVLVPRPYGARTRFDQQIAEAKRLAHVARRLPFGADRRQVLRDATVCLQRALKCLSGE